MGTPIKLVIALISATLAIALAIEAAPPPAASDDGRATEISRQVAELREQGRCADALPLAAELVAIRTDNGTDDQRAADAVQLLETVRRIAELSAAEQRELAEADRTKGEAARLQDEGRDTDAVAAARRQVEVRRRLLGRNHRETLEWMTDLGLLLWSQAETEEVEGLFREMLERATVNRDGAWHRTVLTRHCLWFLLTDENRWDEAADAVRPLLDWCRTGLSGWSDESILTLHQTGRSFYDAHENEDAELVFRAVLEVRFEREGVDAESTQEVLNDLAVVLNRIGRWAEAEAIHRRLLAGRLAAHPDDHEDVLRTKTNLGAVLANRGLLDEAERLNREILEVRRERFEQPGAAPNEQAASEARDAMLRSMNNLAVVLSESGEADELDEAEALYREALRSRRTTDPESTLTADVMKNLALLLHERGEREEPETLMLEQLRLLEDACGVGDARTLSSLNTFAGMLLDWGRAEEAEARYRRSVRLSRELVRDEHPRTVRALTGLGRALIALGEDEEAIPLLTEAVAGYDAARLSVANDGLARAALEHTTARPHHYLAACYARAGRDREAWQLVESALSRGLLDALAARYGRPLTPPEQRRDRTLVLRLRDLDERFASLAAAPDADSNRLRELRIARADAKADLLEFQEALTQRYGPAVGRPCRLEQIQDTLESDTALVYWLDLPANPVTGAPSRDHWGCIVRSVGDPVFVALGGDGSVWTRADDEIAHRLRAALAETHSPVRPLAPELAECNRQRWAPLEPLLAGIRHLVVVPSTATAGIPMEAVLEVAPAGTPRRTVRYVPSGTMHAWLVEQTPPRPAREGRRWTLLAIGNPSLARPDRDREADDVARLREVVPGPIPFSGREVEEIGKLFERAVGGRPEVLIGAEAIEPRVEELVRQDGLRRFRFLHFATHCVMNDRVAMESALVLGPGNGGDDPAAGRHRAGIERVVAGAYSHDGKVTARQIAESWSLDADLVTLSACETALGKYSRGEGYLGFSQALFMAGARQLVLSLWKVDDAATMLLMRRFYANLLGAPSGAGDPEDPTGHGPMTAVAALDEAKSWLRSLTESQVRAELPDTEWPFVRARRAPGIDIRKRHPEPEPGAVAERKPFAQPYHWAGFVVMGTGE